MRMWWNVGALVTVFLMHGALAQDEPPELTAAGKAILQSRLASEGRPLYGSFGPGQPMTFPLPMCTFPGGLCGAVRRDGTVAVPPRYDWVGNFADNRAAVRLHGLYGFVDEDGREVVTPQYRVVEDYKFGFAQVDVDGKSGLIDRDGKMVIEPRYGFIRAIAPDRFRVSEARRLGGRIGAEDFSGMQVRSVPSGGVSVGPPFELDNPTGIIDLSGQVIEPPHSSQSPSFDKDEPSIHWVQRDKLWGLARADGSWLIEPKFQQVDSLRDGLARVTLDGKVGFIDRTGNFAIGPVFDRAWSFKDGLGRTSVEQDGAAGVIDKTGAWVFRTDYQQMYPATALGPHRGSESVFGWNFRKADRWGLLDLDGRVVIDAEFDQSIQKCDGRLIAYKNKEWFYFKADGSRPPHALKIGDKFELVDANSVPLTPVQFDAITWVSLSARNVKIDGKWGRVGSDGRFLLEPKFDYLSKEPDLFVASIDGQRGFMRSDGSWLIEPKFDATRVRDSDTAFVTVAGATGVLRLKDQSWAIAPRPGVMCDINNAIMSQSEGRRAILSRTGETWIDIGAERIGISLDFGLLTFLKDGK